jgi:hypothetical protein
MGEGSSGPRAKLFHEQLASSSDQEISDAEESDVDVCESVLAEDSGGEDCEYLYKCPSWNPKSVEYVSLREYGTRLLNRPTFYVHANDSSSDDSNDASEDRDRDSDGNSIVSGDSCDDEQELADVELEDTLLDFEPRLSNRDVRVLADSVAPSLRGRAPGPAARKLVRLCLQEERVRAVLMALHPRLGRDSPLRQLEPGVVIHIANLIRAPVAVGAPHLAAFDDFRREERGNEAEWEEEMRAELEATSEEEDGAASDDGEALGCLGLPTMADIVESAVTGANAAAGRTAAAAATPAPLRGDGGCAGGAPAAPGCRLEDEALEALERAGEGYLRDLELLAVAVKPPPTPLGPPRARGAVMQSAARATKGLPGPHRDGSLALALGAALGNHIRDLLLGRGRPVGVRARPVGFGGLTVRRLRAGRQGRPPGAAGPA